MLKMTSSSISIRQKDFRIKRFMQRLQMKLELKKFLKKQVRIGTGDILWQVYWVTETPLSCAILLVFVLHFGLKMMRFVL